jgi:hypothetical protein
MSHIINEFNNGNAHNVNGAIGWIIDGEFRPLMSDALAELSEAGLIDADIVTKTNAAREIENERIFSAYRKARSGRRSRRTGRIDVITGQRV